MATAEDNADHGVEPEPMKEELKTFKEDDTDFTDALLTEALAPLRPSVSARMRVSDAMLEVHRRAEKVANTLPEYGWRIFRLGFAFAALLGATVLMYFYPRVILNTDEVYLMSYATSGVFIAGLCFLLFGRYLARIEALLFSVLSQRDLEPSRLEILTLEVFGIFCVLASSLMYWYMSIR